MQNEFFVVTNSKAVENWEALKGVLPSKIYDERPDWNFFGIAIDDKVIGVIGFIYQDIAQIQMIYVEPQYRRQGIATQLIKEFEEYLRSRNLLTNIVFEFFVDEEYWDFSVEAKDNGKDILFFMQSLDDYFLNISQIIYEVTPEIIQKSYNEIDIYKKKFKDEVLLLSQVPTYYVKDFLNLAHKMGIYDIVDMDKWQASLVGDLCICNLHNGKISNAMITTVIDENTISMDYIYSESPIELARLLVYYMNILRTDYSDKTLIMNTINEKSFKLMKRLFTQINVRGFLCEATLF